MTTSTSTSPSTTENSKKSLTTRGNSSLLRELPAILDACAKAGVATLKCGDIEVTFQTSAPFVQYPDYELPSQGGLTIPDSFTASQVSEQPRIETVDKDLLEDMRRAQLMIDDPLSFEQEMIDEYTRRDRDVGRREENHS